MRAASWMLVALLLGCGSFGVTSNAGDAATTAADAGVDSDGAEDGGVEASPCHALLFDGKTDWVEVPDAPDLDPTGPSTVEAWVELTNTIARELHVVAHHRHYAPQSGFVLMVRGTTSSDLVGEARFYDGTTIHRVSGSTMTLFPRSKWTHIAATYDGSAIAVYVDGVQKARSTVTKKPPNANFDGLLKIGHNVLDDDFGWGGRIDEVRISNVARYSAATFAPEERFEVDADTVALWHFDEGAGDIARDATGKHDGKLAGDVKWSEVSCDRR